MDYRYLTSPHCRELILEPCVEDGKQQLRDYKPPPRKKQVIPKDRTRNAFGRISAPRGSTSPGRSLRSRSRTQSPRARSSGSAFGPVEKDCQINVGFGLQMEGGNVNSSAIPVSVMSAAVPPRMYGESVQITSASAGVHLLHEQPRPLVPGSLAMGASAEVPNIVVHGATNTAVEQSPRNGCHDTYETGNALKLSLSQLYQQGYVQDSADSQPIPGDSATAINSDLTSTNQAARHSHTAVMAPSTGCAHSYEVILIQRCAICGCYSAFNVPQHDSTQHRPASNNAELTENVNPYLIGPSLAPAGYGIFSGLNDMLPLAQHQDGMFHFSEASTSEGTLETMCDNQLMRYETAAQSRSSETMPRPRLMIPDAMQYRDHPSAISASASSPASSLFQSTPASDISHGFLSPIPDFPDLDSMPFGFNI